jgi:hypothetical protein
MGRAIAGEMAVADTALLLEVKAPWSVRRPPGNFVPVTAGINWSGGYAAICWVAERNYRGVNPLLQFAINAAGLAPRILADRRIATNADWGRDEDVNQPRLPFVSRNVRRP